jgi:hypothetical protein
MIIIGCDYHPSFQQIAFVDTNTGELQERRLEHREEAERFYRDLAQHVNSASALRLTAERNTWNNSPYCLPDRGKRKRAFRAAERRLSEKLRID